VHNSYATGNVTSSNSYVGGLVGDNWLNDARVQGSVTLNPSVIATRAETNIDVGRVAGRNQQDAFLSGNYARDDMKLKRDGAPYVPTAETAQANKQDGASTLAFHTQAFWTGTLSSWDFSANGDWEWQEGFLPTLRNVGGEQRPVAQEVP